MLNETHPLTEPGRTVKNIDPCILVIFGATGDLTGRKLSPAIYNLGREGQLPANFACVGFARREKTDEEFRAEIKEDISQFSRVKPIDETYWQTFQDQLYYHQSEFDEDTGYEKLAEKLKSLDAKLATRGNRVFYLSVQPKFFPIIIEKLKKHGLVYDHEDLTKWSRVVIEKPFGHDLDSAAELQKDISQHLDESQIFRIDHYLGKETVQNLLVFRFANSIFESLWNHQHIDHVQITVAEDIGIGSRGNFFEEEGYLRDVVQNHMMQLLSHLAMEPPVNLSANAIRDEKVKVLQSIRPLSAEDLEKTVIRAQYEQGFVNGEEVPGYKQEQNVNPNSKVETYLALKLFIDNWRWAGVPFYMRGGKRMPKRGTEIAIIFKDAPGVLFQQRDNPNLPNVLVIRIQPDEGIAMRVNCKFPGTATLIQPVKMDFRYSSYFGQSPPEAYERLIWECMAGDNTLFARRDEVYESWKIMTPILKHWETEKMNSLPGYAAGSWGPKDADVMIESDGREWRKL
jgi:glucose-6-phosphate 1-dehydrogenase